MPPLPRLKLTGPTSEIGSLSGQDQRSRRPSALVGWQQFAQEGEHVPELRWPANVPIFERMLRHSQVDALFSGTCSPLLDYVWWIEPGDADMATVERFAEDVGLPMEEPQDDDWDPPGPGFARFNFLEHLQDALLALIFGFHFFEQTGEVIDGWWRLSKLGPRHPATISQIHVADDGGLEGISQHGYVVREFVNGRPVPQIGVDRLIDYVWRGDARARWTGRSMLRALYAEWLIKDRLMRIDAINHERAGGVPWIKTDESYQGSNLEDLQALASEFRVGEDAGAALPPGADLVLARAGGTDVVGSMRYLDESMARVWSGMVRQLGQTATGSRALGGTFDDIEERARLAIARWFRQTFREHCIEDYFEWNLGPGAPHPTLRCRPLNMSAPTPPAPTPAAVQPVPTGTAPAQGDGPPANPPQAPLRRAAGAVAAASSSASSRALRVPDRPMRREPLDFELRAAVDFAELDRSYGRTAAAVEDLLTQEMLPRQVEAIVRQILFTRQGDPRQRITPATMATLRAPVEGLVQLEEHLFDVAQTGAAEAVAEAAAQGVDLPLPDDATLRRLVADQAEAVAQQVADGMSLAASRRAVQIAPGRTPDEVAREVDAYLHGLEHRWERDQLRGAVQAAQVGGRMHTWEAVPEEQPTHYHSSELLDARTCPPCATEDGRQYPDLRTARRAYPSGGFLSCEGGPRCRGTIVAVFDEAP